MSVEDCCYCRYRNSCMERSQCYPCASWEKRERGAYAEKERSKAIGETKIAIARQKKEQYAGMTAEAVLEEYKDYLSMCVACCKNMADEMVYRPRELKRRHDEVAVDRQQIQILKELENNAEGKYKIGDDANGEETGREQCEERE